MTSDEWRKLSDEKKWSKQPLRVQMIHWNDKALKVLWSSVSSKTSVDRGRFFVTTPGEYFCKWSYYASYARSKHYSYFHSNSRIRPIRLIGICATLINFCIPLFLIYNWYPSTTKSQFVESLWSVWWLPYENINFYLGIDDITLFLVILTTFFLSLFAFLWVGLVWEVMGNSILQHLQFVNF